MFVCRICNGKGWCRVLGGFVRVLCIVVRWCWCCFCCLIIWCIGWWRLYVGFDC